VPADRPVLLLVDNRPSDFIRYVMGRSDIDVVLLRLDAFAEVTPYWPEWGQLPRNHRDETAHLKSFDLRADVSLEKEAARFTRWVGSLPARPRFFCNPEEHAQEVANRFAALVGLPHLTERQVRWVRDKAAMKDRFAELGIPAARHRRITTVGEVCDVAEEFGWPVVLKPVDSFATIDTHRIEGPRALDLLAPTLPDRSWMVEEFVDGTEYQLCALVSHGRVLDTFVSFNPAPLLETLDGAMNADVTIGPHSAGHELRSAVRPLVERLVEGMGLDHGYLHLEFFLTPDGRILMSEIAARLAGGGIPNNHGLSLGFDIFGATLDSYLDRVPELRYTEARCVGDVLLPSSPGRVVTMTPATDLLRLPGVISVRYDVAMGELIPVRRASNARSGLVHVAGATVEEVLDRMRLVLDHFAFTVAEDPAVVPDLRHDR
jgi:biotin carboxylase